MKYEQNLKQCKTCLITKQKSEFYKRTISRDGLQVSCKVCDKKRLHENYLKDLERNRLKRLLWQEANMELHKEHVGNYEKRKKLL